MSNSLIDLLKQFPNCKVTISTARPRKIPHSGDVKYIRGKRYVRRQQYSKFDHAWVVNRRGQPRWEWVQEDAEVED